MHPLIHQLHLVGRHARRLLLCRAAALWVCTVLGVLFIAGCADFCFRFAEDELRWMTSGLVAWIAAWAGYKFVWPAIRFRNDEQAIAQWVERRFPDLQDRLSSAVTFSASPTADLRYGSPMLRQAVVQEAAAAVAVKDLHDCLDPRPARRAGWILLTTIIVIVSVCATDVQSATIAMRRVVMPWRDEVWPRRTWLMIAKSPRKIAIGQDFVVEVIDRRGWLPSEVQILYWFDGDEESDIRMHSMTYARGKMTHRLPQVTRGFRYRAIGGDDNDMGWTRLEVVDEPRVAESTIQLSPPAYTGLTPSINDLAIRGFVGTEVKIAGRASTPIRTAEMHYQSGKSTMRMKTALSPDGIHFQLPGESAAPWLLERSGKFGWALVDQHGVANQLQLNGEIEALADTPPTVTVESPLTEAPFTSQAVIALRLVVRDDLAVQKVALDVAGTNVVIDERANPPVIDSSANWPPRGEQRSVEYSLDLREVGDWKPGQTLALRATASDFRPQLSAPVELTITIITADELKSRLDQRQSALLQRVNEALRLQRSVHSQLLTFQNDATESTPKSQIASDALAGLELGQQRVRDYVAGDQGALRLVVQLLEEMNSNRVNDPELDHHLATTEKELKTLNVDVFPPIEWHLSQAAKQSRLQIEQSKNGVDGRVDFSSALPSVAAALNGQEQAIEALERIVDELAQWAGYRLLAQDVAQIVLEQETLIRETQALPTASRNLIELSDVEQAQLRQLNHRQTELASRLDRLHQRLERMRRQVGRDDEVTVATIEAAIEVLLEQGISSGMRDAGRQLTQNRIGAAERLQESVLVGLRKLHSVLSHRVEQDPAQILEQVRSVGAQVERTLKEQSLAAEKAAAAEQQSANERRASLADVADRERRLIEEIQQLEQQLQRLPANDASRLLRAAVTSMEGAKASAEKGDASAAHRSAAQATEQLAEAAKQLARDQRNAEEAQANIELQWLKESLSAFLAAERSLHDQTAELAKQVTGKNELSADQIQQSMTLARQQRDVSEQVIDAKSRIKQANVFTYALERVAELMRVASQRLGEQLADQKTVDLEAQAIQHLERLSKAMTESSSDSSNVSENQNAEPGPRKKPTQARHSIAELRLLRTWQHEINQRTDALIKTQAETKSLTAEQQRELAELIEEQKRLAELIERFDERVDVSLLREPLHEKLQIARTTHSHGRVLQKEHSLLVKWSPVSISYISR